LFGNAVKRKPSSIFGVLVIISIFLFVPSCIDYTVLIEADLLSSGEKYEDRDVEDILLDKQLNFIVQSIPIPAFSRPGDTLSDSIIDLSWQIPSSDQKSVTLRC
jgi:hypothetical protein